MKSDYKDNLIESLNFLNEYKNEITNSIKNTNLFELKLKMINTYCTILEAISNLNTELEIYLEEMEE